MAMSPGASPVHALVGLGSLGQPAIDDVHPYPDSTIRAHILSQNSGEGILEPNYVHVYTHERLAMVERIPALRVYD